MTATAEPPVHTVEAPVTGVAPHPSLERGEGVELLGDIHGCGYRNGACLVRRGDGQMVQLGPLMYGLLECADGRRGLDQLTDALSERLGRRVDEQHVVRLAEKLAGHGLLAGTEQKAPPMRNPLLALRWKVLVTNPQVTRRLTAPLTGLLRPWLMWPTLACFAAVFWFVLIHKGVASATTEAFQKPALFLLVFVLAIASAGFHELGHAAAARYGGATPGGMGMGLYLVWPAFYTDVTDAYRLPKRDRLRVDLAGLYFNAVIAVITMAVWLLVRADALLLLVALQILQMVKQLSPVIRADGYHILSDATGVPDLFAHMVPTLRRLIPGRRQEPSALTGQARFLVTLWVLIVVPVLLALMVGAILLLPRLATTAWDSGRHYVLAMPRQAEHGQVLDVLMSLVSLVALVLPVAGSALVTQKVVRTTATKGWTWSRGRPARRAAVLIAAVAAIAGMIWAWWPSGQYQPIRATRGGTVPGLIKLVSDPMAAARPNAQVAAVGLSPGKHLAVAMVPAGGVTESHPAFFFVQGRKGTPPVAIVLESMPKTAGAGHQSAKNSAPGSGPSRPTSPAPATAFPFKLPPPPGPHGTQAVAVGTHSGGVTYHVAYSLVTVTGGAPVTETNAAYALADCKRCTTVAVSFQVVLVIGQSNVITPVDKAVALNYNCPACSTTAVANQIVVTLKSKASPALLAELKADLKRLNALHLLGANGTPTAIVSEAVALQRLIESELNSSGLLANPTTGSSSSTSSQQASPAPGGSSSATGQSSSNQGASSPQGGSSPTGSSAPGQSSPGAATTTPTSSTPTTTPRSSQTSGSGPGSTSTGPSSGSG